MTIIIIRTSGKVLKNEGFIGTYFTVNKLGGTAAPSEQSKYKFRNTQMTFESLEYTSAGDCFEHVNALYALYVLCAIILC